MTTPFDQWWDEYPRKVSKIPARVAYAKAARLTDHAWLLSTVKAYRAATNDWAAEDRRFIPYPASWLNAGKYDDDQSEWVDEAQRAVQAKRVAEERRSARIDESSRRRREEAEEAEAESRTYWAKRKQSQEF